uniref:Uncharacterized protein n=1 Tax=Scytodes thoracica TaxID=1112478 RepID=A0A0A0V6V4_SCYTH|nr:conserved hypothetical protein [Scytodes thoracica]
MLMRMASGASNSIIYLWASTQSTLAKLLKYIREYITYKKIEICTFTRLIVN